MSNKGRRIEDLLNKISPAASDVTNPLKIIGDGKMIDGVKNIFNYALDEGRKNGLEKGKKIGFAQGSALAFGLCGAIYLLPKGVKFVKKRISEHKAYNEMGEKIYSALSEELTVNSDEGCVKDEKKKTTKRKTILETMTYAYIRRIKKWMFCPACQNGKMTINKKSTLWTCEECGYKLSADEFEDDYVFWFCDECSTYLNNQEGFDGHASRHICTKCGYENDTIFDNIKGICSDCGKLLPDPDATLCVDCKLARKQKAKEWLKTAGKVVGVASAVAGAVYLASQASGDDEGTGYLPLPDGDKNDGELMGFDYVTDYWMETASEDELRATSDQIQAKLNELDYNSDEHTKLSNVSVDLVNAICSRFPLNLPHREHGWYLPNDD